MAVIEAETKNNKRAEMRQAIDPKFTIRPAGEPFVWFTAMGLGLGLIMICFLLGLILVKGLEVFWPERAVQVTLAEPERWGIQGSPYLAGVVTQDQEKIVRVLDDESAEAPREWQLFTGNKDAYGSAFRYVDFDQIRNVEQPENLIRLERLEYGDAFGYPVAIQTPTEEIPVSHPEFDAKLRVLTDHAHATWEEIRRIEKKEIGKINARLEKLRLERRTLENTGTALNDERFETIAENEKSLQGEYEILAAQARTFRRSLEDNHLIYELPSGGTRRLATGNLVDFYYPNQLNFLERLGRFFQKIGRFLTEEPREANTEGGVFPAIFGTFVMTVLMSAAVTPFGVIAAIYLREYAKQGMFVQAVRIAVNNLAGVPSIVFGVFGLGFFVYFVGGTIDHLFFKEALPTPTFGTGGILWASLTLALLTVPVVIVATEEALAAVPRGMREGSLACGASKWQTIQRIVLPAAAPGILTGLILAMARGAGEVAPLMLVGVVKLAPNLPIDGIFPYVHLERKFMHLGFHIYDLGFQSPDSEAAKPMVFATTLLLIALVVVLNLGAILIRNHLRKKYMVGAF